MLPPCRGRHCLCSPKQEDYEVYVAYHSDGLHHIGWRVYQAPQLPFAPELMADLQTIGCHFPPD